MSGDRERMDRPQNSANASNLLSSNQTSGYFLGSVPREWMQNAGGRVTNTLGAANQNPVQKKPQKRSTALDPSSNYTFVSLESANQRLSFQSHPSPNPLTPSLTPTASPAFSPHTLSESPVQTRFGTANTNVFTNNASINQSSTTPITRNTTASDRSYPSPGGRTPGTADNNHTPALYISPDLRSGNFQSFGQSSGTIDNVSGTISNTQNLERTTGTTRHSTNNGHIQNLNVTTSLPIGLTPLSTGNSAPGVLATNATSSGTIEPSRLQRLSGNTPTSTSRPQIGPVNFPQPQHVALPAYQKVLEDRMAAIKAKTSLNAIDTWRLLWLYGACQHNDLIYLVLHQLASIQTTYPHFLITNLHFSPNHVESLVLLNHIMTDTRNLTPEVLKEFCNFVVPLAGLSTDNSLQAWLPRAKVFLHGFAQRWEILRGKIFARGTPPFAWEIAEDLKSDQFILSQVIYSNFLYQLFPNVDGVFRQAAFDWFKQSQATMYGQRQLGMAQIPPNESRVSFIQKYVNSFKQLARAHRQQPVTDYQPNHLGLRTIQTLPTQTLPPQTLPTQTLPTQISPTQILPTQPNVQGPLISRFPASPANNQISSAGQPALPIIHYTPIPRQIPRNTRSPTQTTFFPRPNFVLPSTVNPDPYRCALHQIHLSHPDRAIEESGRDIDIDARLYLCLDSTLATYREFAATTIFDSWAAVIPPEVFDRRVRIIPGSKANPFDRVKRVFQNGSALFHLRCAKRQSRMSSLQDANWSATATYWPENLFISINGLHLEIRRKVHHGRDLPIDITQFVQQGSNELKLSYFATATEADKSFILALEVIQSLTHDEAIKLPRVIDAALSLAKITDSLQYQNDDEDLIMADPHLSIDLIDPFTARIFDHPVRGVSCRHRECFDLEAFFQSRDCRNKDNIVQPDEWKCPICGEDARPSSLIVDEFLLQVKEKLLASGNTDIKAILVKEDGTWEPKAEVTGNTTMNRNNNRNSNSVGPSALEWGQNTPKHDDLHKAASIASAQMHLDIPLTNEPEIIDLCEEDE